MFICNGLRKVKKSAKFSCLIVNNPSHFQVAANKISYPDAGIPYGDPFVPVEDVVVGVGTVVEGIPVAGGEVDKGIDVPDPVADDG